MKQLLCAFAGVAMLVITGCQQGTSTAPGTAPGSDKRELTVSITGNQTVQQDKTDEMTVSVKRSHFASPVKIELKNLPAGVTVATTDMTIPADKTSLTVTLKAALDAKPVENQPVTVIAKPVEEKDMHEAQVNFDLKVKPKS